MDQFDQEIEAATKRAEERLARNPRVIAAYYDADRKLIVIDLSTGYSVSFAPQRAQGLEHASPADLATIEITAPGYGLHFPKLDADLWVPALLEGIFGSRAWMAAQLGAKGGRATSKAKAQAARDNGKRGGRPAKKTSLTKPAKALGIKSKALGVKKILAERAERAAKRAVAKCKPTKRRA